MPREMEECEPSIRLTREPNRGDRVPTPKEAANFLRISTRLKLTKGTIDALPTRQTDTIYWDAALSRWAQSVFVRTWIVISHLTLIATGEPRSVPLPSGRLKSANEEYND
jgi:hypothetical protein